MAVPTVSITGNILSPSGEAPTSGRVTARLSAPGSALDGLATVRVGAEVSANLTTGGAVSLALVPNDNIVPSGTYYLVTIILVLANGRRMQWAERWSVPYTPTPIDVGSVPRLSSSPTVYYTTEAAVSSGVVAAAEAAQAGAEAAQGASELAQAGSVAAEVASEAAQAGSEAAQDAAQVAQAAAEAARDAALIQPGLYADEPTGRAAVADGIAFKVQGSGDVAAYEYRRVDASSSSLIATYPSAAAIDPLQKSNLSIFAVRDTDGNTGVRIDAPLLIDADGGAETTAFSSRSKSSKWLYAVADSDGNVILAVDAAGRLVANFDLAGIATTYLTGGTYDYEINHVFNYGQSLSVGQAAPAISTAQNYDNVMFVRGMRPQYDYPVEVAAQWYASLQPAVEADSPTQPALAETPSMGTGDMVKELILAEDGLDFTSMKYQLLLSAPGYGATTLDQLDKGTAHFARMVEQATYGLALANAAGKTYAVQAVTWTQGESDYLVATTQAAYLAALTTLVADINTDLKAVTGQTKSIPLIAYQLASHRVAGVSTPNIALALLEAETANPLVYIATPTYHLTYQDTSNFHIDNISSRWLGAYYGLAYKRIVIDGEDWKPLKPLSSVKQGTVAVVKFHVPYGRLEFDTSAVTANTNYGFELVDSGGGALTINSVSIMGPDTVKIVAASAIPAGAKLRYAWSGADNVGNVSGPRGNLRDSQGDSIVFDPQGINKPMHNWCVIFEMEL